MIRIFNGIGVVLVALVVSGQLVHAQPSASEPDIRGPKPGVEIPVPKQPPYALLALAGGVGLAGVLAMVGWKLLARRKRSQTPAAQALGMLHDLTRSGSQLTADEFAARAAATLRTYLATRFGLAAPRRTTEEFLRELATDGSPLIGHGDTLREFLKSCDLSKFAGASLGASQREQLVETARQLILSTSPKS